MKTRDTRVGGIEGNFEPHGKCLYDYRARVEGDAWGQTVTWPVKKAEAGPRGVSKR